MLVIACGIILGCSHPWQKSENQTTVVTEQGSFDRSISWIADTTHSSIQFKARHTDVHDVIGWINRYRVEVTSQRFDFSDASIMASADLRTLMMPNMGMVRNLEQESMFDVLKHPRALFKGSVSRVTLNGGLLVSGQLEIKEVEKPVQMKGTFNGFAYDEAHGLPGFTIQGAFNRYDFNIGARDTSKVGVAVGDSIYFTANLRLYVQEE